MKDGRELLEELGAFDPEAVDELAGSDLVRKALGPHIFDRYVELKRGEWDDYRVQLTDWEMARYLAVL